MFVLDMKCLQCKFFHNKDYVNLTCDAFPQKIPEEIVDNIFIHTKPYPGDNGIMFEEISPAEYKKRYKNLKGKII